MKTPVKSTRPTMRTTKKSVSSKVSHTKRSGVGKFTRAAKRYGKQTLRDLLLSKTFHAGFKVMIGLAIGGSALYGTYAFIGKSVANEVVVSESEILTRIGKHATLPPGEPEAIVRVQDPEALRNQAALYENVKEGDYIVIYPSLAVVYDLRNDRIIALKTTER